jgi:hypothetical protein
MRLGADDPFEDTLPLNHPVPAEASPPECIEDVYL